MEKKATVLLFHFLLVILSYIVAGLTIAAWFAGITPPQVSWFITILGLAMMPLLVINVIFLIIWIASRKWWLVLVPAAAIILNFGFVTAKFRIDLVKASLEDGTTTMKIATYNIHGYDQQDFKGMFASLMKYLESQGVDMASFQEFPAAGRIPLDSIKAVCSEYMPYSVIGNPDSKMSVAFFSRYPITGHGALRFKDTQNGALWADVDVMGEKIRVFNAHFQTTNINQSQREIANMRDRGISDYESKKSFDAVMDRMKDNAIKRVQQVDAVCAIMDTTTRKIIVCGDFNDTPASYTYKHVKKNLIDGFKQCGNGYAYTFKPMMKLLRLDFIMYDDHLTGLNYHSPNLSWSDHNPVIMELLFLRD